MHVLSGLKIALVEFNPSGGLFQFAFQLGEALAARGHQVELVTGPEPELSPSGTGLRVVPRLPTWHATAGAGDRRLRRRVRRLGRALRYHLAWLVLLNHLRRSRPDVVQFSGGRFPVDGLALAWLSWRRRSRRPLVVTIAHAPLPFNEQRATGEIFKGNPVTDRFLGLGYRSLDAIMVLGEQTAADLRVAWPGVERIAVIPHGDEGVFRSGSLTPAGQTDPVVLFFGTMQAYKGLDVLLEAWPAVRDAHPAARLVIAGAPSGDTDLEQLRHTAERVGGVDLRAGYVPLPEVGQLFQLARLVVAPYRYANASGVVELAQTFARPVVATSVGDLPAVVADGHTGLLVPPVNPEALAAAMNRLLADPQEAERMGAAGAERSRHGAAWSVVAERVEEVYRSCADGGDLHRGGER